MDRDDAKAIRRKFAREFCARADAAVKATAPAVLGRAEDEARAVLHEMVQGLIHEIDELERQFLQDLDAVAIHARDFDCG